VGVGQMQMPLECGAGCRVAAPAHLPPQPPAARPHGTHLVLPRRVVLNRDHQRVRRLGERVLLDGLEARLHMGTWAAGGEQMLPGAPKAPPAPTTSPFARAAPRTPPALAMPRYPPVPHRPRRTHSHGHGLGDGAAMLADRVLDPHLRVVHCGADRGRRRLGMGGGRKSTKLQNGPFPPPPPLWRAPSSSMTRHPALSPCTQRGRECAPPCV
jgi:hypothetical protein